MNAFPRNFWGREKRPALSVAQIPVELAGVRFVFGIPEDAPTTLEQDQAEKAPLPAIVRQKLTRQDRRDRRAVYGNARLRKAIKSEAERKQVQQDFANWKPFQAGGGQ